jgi:hypothetical protein
LPLRAGTPNSLRQISARIAIPYRISCVVGLAKHSRAPVHFAAGGGNPGGSSGVKSKDVMNRR